jgi:hypothetical protein
MPLRVGGTLPWILLVLTLALSLALWFAYDRAHGRLNVLTAGGGPEVVVMDFSNPITLSPPPPGWYHRRFWTRAPMQMSFALKDGVPAIRLETRSSASMLFRHVEIDVATYPILIWRWYIEQPIESPLDEQTREGDDHPARLFLTFKTAAGEERRMEIIWGNRLKAGEYKYIGTFPHYVADGGIENVGRWRTEEVDLRPVYRHIWPDNAAARLVDIALFCDSDETHTHSIAYVADVRMTKAK